MATLIHDAYTEAEVRAQRAKSGADRWDEVWEGVYVMNPLPNNEHQRLITGLTHVLYEIIELNSLGRVFPGVNVSDRKENWDHNYRGPDVVVYLNETEAEDCGTFYYGGPDLAIEVLSPNDTAREKLEFYAKVNTQEVLIIDRYPWQLELYRLAKDKLVLVDRSTETECNWIASEVVSLKMRLQPSDNRPMIELVNTTDQKTWQI